MSDKLREERRKNSEKLIEKTKAKAVEKKEELAETLEEKKEDDADGKVKEKSTPNKAEQLLNEKLAASKDSMIYLNDTDIRTIIEAAKEDNTGKANTKQQVGVGANLDLQV